MLKSEIRAKIQEAKDNGRTLQMVLTEKGQFEHLQGTWTKTVCGKDIDRARTEGIGGSEDASYFMCMTCDKARRNRW